MKTSLASAKATRRKTKTTDIAEQQCKAFANRLAFGDGQENIESHRVSDDGQEAREQRVYAREVNKAAI